MYEIKYFVEKYVCVICVGNLKAKCNLSCFLQASVNPLQGFLNCLVYGQHGQFASCFGHIWSRFQTTDALDDDFQEERSTWTANSLSGSVKIPVSEISPLLAGSRRSTPLLSTPISDNSSPREPFHAKLLGEFSHLN